MAAATAPESGAITFGPFRLMPGEMLLLEDGSPVELGSRALDILIALARRPGELVGKDELIAAAWPDTKVDEANLRVQVAALRRVLRDGQKDRRYLLTIPGRGYRFVGLPARPKAEPAAEQPSSPARDRLLPAPLGRLIGREDMVHTILMQLRQRRSVTIVGPGGIGKTAVALHVAQAVEATFPDGACFVDLSLVSGPDLAIGAIAVTLGLSLFSSDAGPGVLAFLHSKRLLLVLDCCEHVVDGVGALVERVLKEAQGVHVLATSREPLRAEGERVLRLPPLGLPPAAAGLSASDMLGYPAVQLFVERASAAMDGFVLTDADAPVVADICVRLDGIALAIELVAGHVAAFDLQTLSAMLNDRFRLLARGRRDAMQRHQTMSAVLDWSYQTITETERILLRRLSVFDGAAPLTAVREVAGGPGLTFGDTAAALADLVDKSLVATRLEARQVCYRLLDTTRAYALDRLAESGELADVCRRHARHYVSVFARSDTEWPTWTSAEWLGIHGREIGNARAALDWAFSPDGDCELGISLAAASLPVMFELSLLDECRRRAMHALSALARVAGMDRRVELTLRAIAAAAQMYTPGPLPQSSEEWRRVLQLAIELNDFSHQARAVWGLWTACNYGGRAREAMAFASRYNALSGLQNQTAMQVLGDRIIGVSEFYLGQLETARSRLEGMLDRYAPSAHRWKTLGFVIDHGMMARATLARLLWLLGKPDRAWALAQQTLAAAQQQGHAISQCYVLLEGVLPLAFMLRDRDAVSMGIKLLGDLSEQNGLAIWKAAVRVLWLVARLTGGSPVQAVVLFESLADLSATGYEAHHAWLSGLIADELGKQGDTEAALGLIDAALARCDATGEAWIVPELLRVKASILATSPKQQAAAAAILCDALALADQMHALSWRLRILLSAARQYGPDGCDGARLAATLDKFGEGFGTPDLLEARAALQPIPT